MTLLTEVLFDRPQAEIASRVDALIRAARTVRLVSGFATVEGVRRLESALAANAAAIDTVVIGAGTFQSYEAIDRLLVNGVDPKSIYVHLGHTRLTGPNAKHRFYRYHPMLHSKIYYFDLSDGNSEAVIGSHNMTGYAMGGLNGEAAISLRGPTSDVAFRDIRTHIETAKTQSVLYDPSMKEAYAWWAWQALEGISSKANDLPKDGESKRTIVLLTESRTASPKRDDYVYFELPAALGRVTSMRSEVHIFVFDTLPPTPQQALLSLASARQSLWCTAAGIEDEKGGVELVADWQVANHGRPRIDATPSPFRPTPGSDMQQVRVKVHGPVRERFEYLFAPASAKWIPLLDDERSLRTVSETFAIGAYWSPNPEDTEWHLVSGLIEGTEAASLTSGRTEELESGYSAAVKLLSPESGSYVMFSPRRRKADG